LSLFGSLWGQLSFSEDVWASRNQKWKVSQNHTLLNLGSSVNPFGAPGLQRKNNRVSVRTLPDRVVILQIFIHNNSYWRYMIKTYLIR